MPVRALRLLHTANLRLDAGLSVCRNVPDDVGSILDEATAIAFSHVVSTAIEQDVDAVLITGNTFDAASESLSAEVTLRRELERLNELGLPVFISPGVLDPAAAWQEMPPLPENVTVFLEGHESGVELTDRGRRLATLLPVSAQTGVDAPELERIRAPEKSQRAQRDLMIGLWIPHRSPTTTTAGFSSLDYLAAGAAATGLPLTEGHIHLQPGPQGLDATAVGIHGCQLVDFDAEGHISSRQMATAPVRWETANVHGRGVKNFDDLCERMLAQLETLPAQPHEQVRIMTWPLEQTLLESLGLTSERDFHRLSTALQELTDQPKQGLRYLHRIQPVCDETTVPPGVDRELWQDYLTEMERCQPVQMDRLQKLWEQQTGSAAAPTGWPAEDRWPSVNPERVRRLALQNGRRWFQPAAGGTTP